MYIYKITNLINNKIYIGQTVRTIKQRFNQHCNCQNMLISKSIQKYGKENFKIEVINEFATIDELNYFEEYYISLFNSLAPNGYNLDSGGLNKFLHQSTKDKMSKLHTNRKTKNSSSQFYGVNKHYFGFQARYRNNQMIKCLTSSKSEKWCAYIYDQYCIENNLIERKLNGISYEEAYQDFLKYYGHNGLLKTKTSKYKHVNYCKIKNVYIAKMFLDNKIKFIGRFKTEIEAVKACNQYIIDNNINKPLQEI